MLMIDMGADFAYVIGRANIGESGGTSVFQFFGFSVFGTLGTTSQFFSVPMLNTNNY